MYLPNFYSISIETKPIAPSYNYGKVFVGTIFNGSTCNIVEIVKDAGVMTVDTSTACSAILPRRSTVTL